MLLMVEINQDGPNSPVRRKGSAVLLPHEAIGNVVTKTNTLIIEHREWLANLPQRKKCHKREESNSVTPPPNLITPAPSLGTRFGARQIAVLPECGPVSSSLASQISSLCSTCSVRIASLQAALVNAESAFTSVQLSAGAALSKASTNASIAVLSVSVSVSSSASSALAVAQASASSAISSATSSAQSSASLAKASAQSSASVSVLSANNALISVQISARSAIASASSVAQSVNDVASQARATASLAIQLAQASIAAAQQSASASATRVAAMNETVLALTITFSLIGSSLISILVYYLISRCRRRRRERKQSELKERIHRVRHESDESLGPSLSAFPMPVGRDKWVSRSRPNTVETAEMTGGTGGMLSGSATLPNPLSQPGSAPLRGNGEASRRTWAPTGSREVQRRGGGMSDGEIDFAFGIGGSGQNLGGMDVRKTWAARETIPEERGREMERRGPLPMMVRKNTLTYDPEHPDRPPKFTTRLEESFRSVSQFPDLGGDMEGLVRKGKGRDRASFMEIWGGQPKRQSLIQRRRSRSMGEVSDIGTAI